MTPRQRTILRSLKAAQRALQETIATANESKAQLLRIESARLADAASVLVRVLNEDSHAR